MARLKTLAISIASGRVGYVFFDGNQLIDWGIASQATKTSTTLVGFVQELINQLKTDAFVSLKPDTETRKGIRTR